MYEGGIEQWGNAVWEGEEMAVGGVDLEGISD